MQKVRGYGYVYPASTDCKQLVSDSISLPSRGSFHLSLTVLVRYRWPGVFSLRGWSPQIPPGFLVSRGTWVVTPSPTIVRYRTVTVSGLAFQQVHVTVGFLTRCGLCHDHSSLPQPLIRNAGRLGTDQVWALPRSLAATDGISFDFSSSRY